MSSSDWVAKTDAWGGPNALNNNSNTFGGTSNRRVTLKGWWANIPFLAEQKDNALYMGHRIWDLYTMKSQINIGDCVDWLNFVFMPTLLGLFALLNSAHLFGQIISEPMTCLKPSQLKSVGTDNNDNYNRQYQQDGLAQTWKNPDIAWKWMQDYCSTKNTYFVPFNETFPRQSDQRMATEIAYYHWIPIVLLLQAVLFMLPNCFWRHFNKYSGIGFDVFLMNCQMLNDMLPEELADPIDAERELICLRQKQQDSKEKRQNSVIAVNSTIEEEEEKKHQEQEEESQEWNNDDDENNGWGKENSDKDHLLNNNQGYEGKKKKCTNKGSLENLEEWYKLRNAIVEVLSESIPVNSYPSGQISTTICGFRLSIDALCMSWATLMYLAMKVFYVVNIVVQFVAMNIFIAGNAANYKWGYQLLKTLVIRGKWKQSHLFPRTVFCDIPMYLIDGTTETITVQCHLHVNYYNEKIYLLLWWIFLFIGIITFCNLLYNFVHLIFNRTLIPDFVIAMLAPKQEPSKQIFYEEDIRNFTEEWISLDGYLLLWFVQHHFGEEFTSDLVSRLFARYVEFLNKVEKDPLPSSFKYL